MSDLTAFAHIPDATRAQEREEAFRAWSVSPIVRHLTDALAGSVELPGVLSLLHHAYSAGYDTGGHAMLMHTLTKVFNGRGGR